MKKIMILAGGNDQVALIHELRRYFKNKVEIILLDMSDNVRALSYADKFLKISTMDREAVLQAAKNENIDYIFTACGDQPLSTMAYVSEKLNLPTYLSIRDVVDLTNKKYMKVKMLKNNIPTSKFMVLNSFEDRKKIYGLKFPLVVKPVDSNGSKGVKKVFNIEELDQKINEAYMFSLSGDVIVEEFNSGVELSVDVYVEGKEAKLLSITSSRKIKQNEDSFTIVQSIYPAEVEYDEEKIIKIIKKIVCSFHLKDTPLLVQMIVKNDEYNVLEFSARIGGGSKYKLIQTLSGVNIMKVYVEMLMGEKPKVNPNKLCKFAVMNYVYCVPGKFVQLINFDTLKESNTISDYFIYKMPNSIIEKSNTSSDRVAGYLLIADTAEELKNKSLTANQKLAVIDDFGNDLMIHNFFD